MKKKPLVSLNPTMQHYMITFVSDLLQVGDFHLVLLFPPPKKTARHDITEILFNTNTIIIILNPKKITIIPLFTNESNN